MYIKRALEETILSTSNSFPVLMLIGPRQVGKTTMLEKLNNGVRKYVTLDNPLDRQMAVNEPDLFLQRYSPPVIIDEIQYAPQLLPYIKMYVDTHKIMGDFWLTGSQMFHMMKNVSESLAGRVGIVTMLGLSNSEIDSVVSTPYTTDSIKLMDRLNVVNHQSLTQVYERIFLGGMPAIYSQKVSHEKFYSSYLQTYLQRDIKDLTQVGNELDFLRFMECIAARTGQILNYSDIAKDVGISAPTAKHWFSILVSSNTVAVIEPYFNNILKRAIKSPKFYFLDTGLCAYLTRWNSPESLEKGAMSGAFFETYVVSEIIKSYYNDGKRHPLYYYRDKDQKEIDLLICTNGTLWPIEIKKSGNPDKSSIKHFSVLDGTGLKIGEGNVICMVNNLIPITKENWYVPVWLL